MDFLMSWCLFLLTALSPYLLILLFFAFVYIPRVSASLIPPHLSFQY
jgi:hypothetical protein